MSSNDSYEFDLEFYWSETGQGQTTQPQITIPKGFACEHFKSYCSVEIDQRRLLVCNDISNPIEIPLSNLEDFEYFEKKLDSNLVVGNDTFPMEFFFNTSQRTVSLFPLFKHCDYNKTEGIGHLVILFETGLNKLIVTDMIPPQIYNTNVHSFLNDDTFYIGFNQELRKLTHHTEKFTQICATENNVLLDTRSNSWKVYNNKQSLIEKTSKTIPNAICLNFIPSAD
ncbi:predicted protein [Naegleria gruberi]|uniref:Predicted protein n=1 Tax=Naegleria gruberi TaxID=5762 RepID=D2V446_NAEGR|nr:uncharacterized protein NAEGRDRAFT_63594 [Naegleria gruberi]EFC48457.1 predicted protein [Naegleria gruberi]|eukprot:XP_002681201.1 predicted protein [Naegleria gruberi strain NEG-M]